MFVRALCGVFWIVVCEGVVRVCCMRGIFCIVDFT